MGTAARSSETIILDLLRLRRSLRLEQVVAMAPELTWNQIFTTVDQLSRRGEIILLRRGFEYEVVLSPQRTQPVSCSG